MCETHVMRSTAGVTSVGADQMSAFAVAVLLVTEAKLHASMQILASIASKMAGRYKLPVQTTENGRSLVVTHCSCSSTIDLTDGIVLHDACLTHASPRRIPSARLLWRRAARRRRARACAWSSLRATTMRFPGRVHI